MTGLVLVAMVVGALRSPSHLAAPSAPAGAQVRQLMGWGGVLGPGALLAEDVFFFCPHSAHLGNSGIQGFGRTSSLDTPWLFLLMVKAEDEL